ncbi:glutathione S-transferase family protein [Alkalimonas delamerensis]|uniref:Glutathione S-transferase family protein n=1 Tax=Alkalimonas delamerensis TaxID=265981 RepID=A0ABT9GR67_9GAMM|nr:glutathione S-transferase family protein [Alkalimonas delamerensis]MDP4529473.1 glutathione S-transferase family protein [Alkalimonas delamerensis]
MGLLVNGKWQDRWYDTKASSGRFQRQDSSFRDDIQAHSQPDASRYHLYVSLACPWAHRTLILRQLKSLQSLIPVTVVSPIMLEHGWEFDGDGGDREPLYNLNYMHQLYTKAKADYSGRVTVPVLWDRLVQRLVNNESADILRIFNRAFNHQTGNRLDFYPAELRDSIDEVNAWVYRDINNGVYKAGFATSQDAYQEAFEALFKALDKAEQLLTDQRFLTGDYLTEADWRLFTTLIRFDAVYVGHFKCNLRRIADYPALSHYLRSLYQVPGIAETVNMDHIKRHYYISHPMINPTQIVPEGPAQDFSAPHNRGDWQLEQVVLKSDARV